VGAESLLSALDHHNFGLDHLEFASTGVVPLDSLVFLLEGVHQELYVMDLLNSREFGPLGVDDLVKSQDFDRA
jgi:hypothetical protein